MVGDSYGNESGFTMVCPHSAEELQFGHAKKRQCNGNLIDCGGNKHGVSQ